MFDKLRNLFFKDEEEKILENEIKFVKYQAKEYLKKYDDAPPYHPARIRTSTLRTMCRYILKTKPKKK